MLSWFQLSYLERRRQKTGKGWKIQGYCSPQQATIRFMKIKWRGELENNNFPSCLSEREYQATTSAKPQKIPPYGNSGWRAYRRERGWWSKGKEVHSPWIHLQINITIVVTQPAYLLLSPPFLINITVPLLDIEYPVRINSIN